MVAFTKAWKEAWAYLGPIITVIGLWEYWTPALSIVPGLNLNPSEAFQTQFVVTNTGHTSLYDLSFKCSILGRSLVVEDLSTDPLPYVSELEKLSPVSRGCFGSSLVDGVLLKVTVRYRWPILNKFDERIAFFSVKHGDAGQKYIVPEAAPTPEPPAMLEVYGEHFPH